MNISWFIPGGSFNWFTVCNTQYLAISNHLIGLRFDDNDITMKQ